MRTFFTSDLHFGHESAATKHRPFDTVTDHDSLIIRNWMETVDEGDEVYVLGDIASSHSTYALAILAGLPGVKHLIAGNHDRVHPKFKNGHRYLREYLETFETVQTALTLQIAGERVTLSHFPFTADHTDPPRHMAWRVQDVGQWLIHGHTHSDAVITGPRQIHVGVDAWDFTPVPVHAVEQEMRVARALFPAAA